MLSSERTGLWSATLAEPAGADPFSTARSRLRTSLLAFRDRVSLLVNEIHRDLPDYTVHDISHLDALWEVADIICGPAYRLTPTEAFVLGGAIFVHDAGMSLAAYPEGSRAIRAHPTWRDVVALRFESRFKRPPTRDELDSPPDTVTTEATAILLRNLHAAQAEQLALRPWRYGGEHYLIEDSDIRNAWGRIIGLIGHSHWWPVRRLEESFSRVLGPPHWCPSDWTVDPLKVACILRLADAAHIDARRAPAFLMALRTPRGASREHWTFQSHLHRPTVDADALTYTSGHAFSFTEATAWWLCYDTLMMIDGELRQVDALLADKGMQRLAARRVAAVDSPERLSSWIPTDGWMPVDASLNVSDVPELIRKLGGSALYGDVPEVALRELIQNATDAIRARVLLEQRDPDWGCVEVQAGSDERGDWLQVSDNGIGMSRNVLTRHLLDFGGSFWKSYSVAEELPGLMAAGMKAAGKFGIGFFSVFMLGSRVQVRTRRADAAQRETLVLELAGDLYTRPILRYAGYDEQLRDGGTCVRVWLDGDVKRQLFRKIPTLARLCSVLCVANDVTIRIEEPGATPATLRREGWIKCSGPELVERLLDIDLYSYPGALSPSDAESGFLAKVAQNLRELRNPDGEIVGRACISLSPFHAAYNGDVGIGGVCTGGGFTAAGTIGIAGVLLGTTTRAARDSAVPIVSRQVLREWASEQADLVPSIYAAPQAQAGCAASIRKAGGDTRNLPIAYFKRQWLTATQIAELTHLPSTVFLAPLHVIVPFIERPKFEPRGDVFFAHWGWQGLINRAWGPYTASEWWPDLTDETEAQELYFIPDLRALPHLTRIFIRSIQGLIAESVARSWGVQFTKVVSASQFGYDRQREQIIATISDEELKSYVDVLKNPVS